MRWDAACLVLLKVCLRSRLDSVIELALDQIVLRKLGGGHRQPCLRACAWELFCSACLILRYGFLLARLQLEVADVVLRQETAEGQTKSSTAAAGWLPRRRTQNAAPDVELVVGVKQLRAVLSGGDVDERPTGVLGHPACTQRMFRP